VFLIMEGEKDMFESPPPTEHEFHTGDMVHVFEGTGVGNVKTRHVAWFGRVVGREGDLYLVRNRVLAAKGRPSLVEGKFMQKQTDFGLACGTEKRVHFGNLTKRTRERILLSADERNNEQLDRPGTAQRIDKSLETKNTTKRCLFSEACKNRNTGSLTCKSMQI
jgi:hypothetical protein